MTKVSVILAVYNSEKFIKETLESLVLQSYKNFEIIAVDDCSTDKTSEIINGFNDKRIRYFKTEKNSGLPAAPRNIGIENASGEIIAFCDQDDLWYSEKLSKQIEAYEKCEIKDEIGIIVTSVDIIDEKGKKIGKREIDFEGFLEAKESFEKLLDNDFITNCSAVIPKKILNEIGLLDENLKGNDDYDLWLRITEKYGIYGIKDSLCAWRRHEKAASREMSNIFKENKKIFDKLLIDEKENKKPILEAENKNQTRLFISLVGEKNFKEAKEALISLKPIPEFKKANLLIKVFNISPWLAYFILSSFRKLKRLYQ